LGVDFEETLTALLGMVGRRVSVSASGVGEKPPLAMIAHGTLGHGSELGDLAGEEEEASTSPSRRIAVRVSSSTARTSGARAGAVPILEITVGGVVLRVEPESGS
jgi:hypothetical protein